MNIMEKFFTNNEGLLSEATTTEKRAIGQELIRMALKEEAKKISDLAGDLAIDLLGPIAKVFAATDAVDEFTYENLERVTKLLERVMNFGYTAESLELVYVPGSAAYTFESLLKRMHQIRKDKGCEWEDEWRWTPLWTDKAEVFGDYGIKEEAQFVVMLKGENQDGLFFTDTEVGEQIARARELFAKNEGTDWLSPAAYISANIVRVASDKPMLDIPTFTRFPQFSEDGFIETADGRWVPYACVYGVGQFELVHRVFQLCV